MNFSIDKLGTPSDAQKARMSLVVVFSSFCVFSVVVVSVSRAREEGS